MSDRLFALIKWQLDGIQQLEQMCLKKGREEEERTDREQGTRNEREERGQSWSVRSPSLGDIVGFFQGS